jgi:hypothetical protein
MKRIALLILILVISCSDKISEASLDHLNGYWEIEKVIFPDGSSKEYTVNTNIDYIFIEDKKGYRKKVQPRLDGTYDTSNDADPFIILERKGILSIHYNTENHSDPMIQRSEELVSLTNESFSVRNADGITYRYKRFEPVNIKE